MKLRGFTLISFLIALSLLGLLFSYTALSSSGFLNSLKVKAAAQETASYLRMAQSRALSEKRTIKVIFTAEGYSCEGKSVEFNSGVRLQSDKEIAFSNSGFPPPGYSGTLTLLCGKFKRKVVVSSIGRVRIE